MNPFFQRYQLNGGLGSNNGHYAVDLISDKPNLLIDGTELLYLQWIVELIVNPIDYSKRTN